MTFKETPKTKAAADTQKIEPSKDAGQAKPRRTRSKAQAILPDAELCEPIDIAEPDTVMSSARRGRKRKQNELESGGEQILPDVPDTKQRRLRHSDQETKNANTTKLSGKTGILDTICWKT